MFKKHVAVLVALGLIAAASLIYGSQALAELSAFDPAADVFNTRLILVPETIIPNNQEVKLIEARPVIARRLDRLGLNGPYNLAIRYGQLEVTLPKNQNISYIASVITSLGEITFIDGGSESPPLGNSIETAWADSRRPQILFTSREVTDIALPDSASGQIFYRLTLQSPAAARLAAFTATHPHSFLCMALDNQVINCSTMYHLTDNKLEILPELSSSTAANMSDLSVFLYSGPLATRLKVLAD